jgi:hypothetical protein
VLAVCVAAAQRSVFAPGAAAVAAHVARQRDRREQDASFEIGGTMKHVAPPIIRLRLQVTFADLPDGWFIAG